MTTLTFVRANFLALLRLRVDWICIETATLRKRLVPLLRRLGGVGGDSAADLYIQRCAELVRNPPKRSWDGVTVIDRK